MEQAAAKHFCQLFVCSNEGNITTLNTYIRQQPSVVDDSLTVEQMFTSYVFDYNGWQTLKVFPHRSANGTVVWYAAGDPLPNDMDVEHQKYIQQVFPHLQQEIEHENWPVVNAYIDRMIQYQPTFGSPWVEAASPFGGEASPSYLLPLTISLFLAFLAIPFCKSFLFKRR